LEKERIASEERLNKLREFNQHLQVKRQQDKEERIRQLVSKMMRPVINAY
jgi:hypothetical protein